MTQLVRTVMTPNPVCVAADTSLMEVARKMRDRNIGDVLVVDGEQLRGVVTDRDVVVRGVATGSDPTKTAVRTLASENVVTVKPDDSVDKAIRLMADHSVRRVPVVDGGKPVGVVSLGDLAVERDPTSALADISAAPPNQ